MRKRTFPFWPWARPSRSSWSLPDLSRSEPQLLAMASLTLLPELEVRNLFLKKGLSDKKKNRQSTRERVWSLHWTVESSCLFFVFFFLVFSHCFFQRTWRWGRRTPLWLRSTETSPPETTEIPKLTHLLLLPKSSLPLLLQVWFLFSFWFVFLKKKLGSITFNPLKDTLPDAAGKPFKLQPPTGDDLPRKGFCSFFFFLLVCYNFQNKGFDAGKDTYLAPASQAERAKINVAIDPKSSRFCFCLFSLFSESWMKIASSGPFCRVAWKGLCQHAHSHQGSFWKFVLFVALFWLFRRPKENAPQITLAWLGPGWSIEVATFILKNSFVLQNSENKRPLGQHFQQLLDWRNQRRKRQG